jgi:succinate dehydrogenase / fumarate reductase flavoprotein subunit
MQSTGYALGVAYRAGIPLKDMEFVQFHPTSLLGKNILITEAARGEGGYLVNVKGRRFMEDYAPTAMELAPRDIVARSIQTEIDNGRGFDGRFVHLDLRHLGREKIVKRLPGIRDICIHFAGLDPVEAPIPILPAQHYSMGGIDVDAACASSVEGFFAAGECACVSVHGANRLGGNSLLEAIVFGQIAGESASAYLRSGPAEVDGDRQTAEAARGLMARMRGVHERRSGENVFQLLNRLKALMSDTAGIFRDAPTLRRGLEELAELREAYRRVFILGDCGRYCQEMVVLTEFEHMLEIAEVILASALNREETRGSHYRTDFPKRDDAAWLKHTIITYSAEGPVITSRPLKAGRYAPQERKY